MTGSEVSKHGGKGKASDYMLYLMTFSGGGGGGRRVLHNREFVPILAKEGVDHLLQIRNTNLLRGKYSYRNNH